MLFLHALLFFVLGTSAMIVPLRPRAGQSSRQTQAAGTSMDEIDEILYPSSQVDVISSYYGLWHPRDKIGNKQVPLVAVVGHGAHPLVATIDHPSVNRANVYNGYTPFVRVKNQKEYNKILGEKAQAPKWPKIPSNAHKETIWIHMDEHGQYRVGSQMEYAAADYGTAHEQQNH
ncbi:hypothetical protein F5887DRAFT_569282 [Amanita rubescens]|nr:hypothetical protein F5887DRAFT_569282 [Amanita rubescens]